MKKYRKLWIPVFLIVIAVVLYSALAGAVWNPDEAVQYTAAQYDEVEPSTFLIGTHLIHLNALTEQLYEVAQASADSSGQNAIYYKSELADGTWFDITTASSLADITTGGTPVTTDTLTSLYLTHKTGSDGVTIDLRTGEAVNLYDISDPYDIESLDEMLPLKNQYDLIAEQQKDSAAGKEKMARIEEVFATNVRNDTTNNADAAIAALQVYHDVLTENDADPADISAVESVMSALNATRRAEVFTILEPVLDSYSTELTQMQDTQDEDGQVTSADGGDSALQDAANQSYQNVTNSKIEQQGKMLTEGTTVSSKAEYALSMQLVADAEANNHAACDTDVDQLIALDNILSGNVGNRETELALLEDTLLPDATEMYLQKLSTGETAEYQQQSSANAAGALLNNLISAGTSEANSVRSELESFIEAECLRLTNDEGISFLDTRLEEATGYYDQVAADDFETALRGTVDEHIAFLTSKKRELELAGGGNALDKAIAEKSALQQQLLSALDKNDLVTAQSLEGQIAALDDQIAALEKEQSAALADLQNQKSALEDELANGNLSDAEKEDLNAQLNQLNTQIAQAQASMSDGTLGNIVAQLRAEALDLIGDTSASALARLLDKINSLGDLLPGNAATVFPALKDIHSALVSERDLNGETAYGDAIAAVEALILDNSESFAAAMQGDKTADELQQIIDDFFAQSDLLDAGTGVLGSDDGTIDLSALSDNEKAVISLLALNAYAEDSGSTNAQNLLTSLLQNQFNLGNPFVFLDVSDSQMEYVPAKAIAALTGMRRVWNKTYRCATLAKGTAYYTFTVYSDAVTTGRNAEETIYMDAPVKYQNDAYIPETYTQSAFGASAQPISGTGLAILQSDAWNSAVEELFAQLMA